MPRSGEKHVTQSSFFLTWWPHHFRPAFVTHWAGDTKGCAILRQFLGSSPSPTWQLLLEGNHYSSTGEVKCTVGHCDCGSDPRHCILPSWRTRRHKKYVPPKVPRVLLGCRRSEIPWFWKRFLPQSQSICVLLQEVSYVNIKPVHWGIFQDNVHWAKVEIM